METMTALRMVEWSQPPEFCEVPVPAIGPEQVLVRVAAVGLCHTDVHFLHAKPGDFAYPMPFTLGHEIAGHVARVGEHVGGLTEGAPVAVALGPRCWRCEPCLRGADNTCVRRSTGRGWGQDGGLAHYVAVPAREVVPLRSLDPASAAPLADAGVTGYAAARRVVPKLRGDSTALVIGVGGLGGFGVQVLRQLTSSRIIVVETSPEKLARARSFGADIALDARDVTVDTIRDLTRGYGADAVLDFVGVDATLDLALKSARAGGAVAIVGAGGGTVKVGWGLLPGNCDLFIQFGGTTADFYDVIAMAEAGRLTIDIERFPFDRTLDAYARVDAGAVTGRAVVTIE